eukprot:CAMPEP_0167763368 /NCGR_PEP_ID=MMETSP0110_2-20121227/13324_1 /TAXON_ID=629695 /ORGANISM="Gymnochlora sp., Strain CCMP2014" /LENGTH=160 /DNA_ID=CAMNT_0007650425 /DNA_START=159 /DNA_END=641 /DNA_ORIENTATION=+
MAKGRFSSFEELDQFLSSVGLQNRAERARLIDLNTNPRSLFAGMKNKKGSKARINARPLSIERDIRPVIDYLIGEGLTKDDLPRLITSQPALIGYDVDSHLRPLIDYLKELGVEDVPALLVKRPTLLGLNTNDGLRKIVNYLKSVDTPVDKIIDYLGTSI